MLPYFSIIIPTYNRAGMLPVAIESVINQTFKDWELLIIDDGSKDNTAEVVSSYTDERIKYFFQENQERCAARNNGVEKSSGKYICFLDSDDYFLSERLELLHREILELKEPLAFIFTGASFEKENIIRKGEDKSIENFCNKYDFFMLSHIHCQQTVIPREMLLKNKFNIRFNIAEDTELWLRIISSNNFIFIKNQNTVVVKEHDDRSINVSKNNVYAKVFEVFSFMRKEYNYPFSKELVKSYNRDGCFGIAKYHIFNNNRFNAVKYILYSLFIDLRQTQFKYKINILIYIFININYAKKLIQ